MEFATEMAMLDFLANDEQQWLGFLTQNPAIASEWGVKPVWNGSDWAGALVAGPNAAKYLSPTGSGNSAASTSNPKRPAPIPDGELIAVEALISLKLAVPTPAKATETPKPQTPPNKLKYWTVMKRVRNFRRIAAKRIKKRRTPPPRQSIK